MTKQAYKGPAQILQSRMYISMPAQAVERGKSIKMCARVGGLRGCLRVCSDVRAMPN